MKRTRKLSPSVRVSRRAPAAAFSLVEIVLALGVISFALVAVIGLLPIGFQASRASIQETRATLVADAIFSTLRGQPFKSASLSTLGNTGANLDLSTRGAAGPEPISLYASYEGEFKPSSDYFTIEVTFANTPAGLPAGSANEVRVRVSPREMGTTRMDYVSIISAR